MERWVPERYQLDARDHFNMTLNASAARETPWIARNETRALIKNLKEQQVQTLRTMHVVLGAFSLAVVLLTVHQIIWDARRVAAMKAQQRKTLFSFRRGLHPAETFPLVLACGSAIQQIIFISAQSTSLRSQLSDNCRIIAMFTFPAIFVMGYLTLVFGVEMAVRGFKPERFAPRGRWNAFVCVGTVLFLLLLTWIPTVAWPMYNRCFGSLIWFTVRYELITITILIVLLSSSVLLAALISIQLMGTTNVDPNERIAASRMCYYLLMSAVVYSLVIPVQVQAHRKDFMNTLTTSRIAEVSLFTSGILMGLFHLFLRANATRMAITPMNNGPSQSSPKKRRPRLRLFGPSDLELNISGPLALEGGHRPDSRQGLIDAGTEKNRHELDAEYCARHEKPLSPDSMRSFGSVDPTKWPLPPPPEPLPTNSTRDPNDTTPGSHKRQKSSYSLFPTRAEDIPRLPATVYHPRKSTGEKRMSRLALRRQTRQGSISDAKSVTDVNEAFNFLSKPPSLFPGRHRRDQSTDSSATVQIGLRFSVAPATLAAAKCTAHNRQVTTPALRRDRSDSSGETLGLPIQVPSTVSNSTNPTPSEEPAAIAFPQPPPRSPSPSKIPPLPLLPSTTYVEARRSKVLPPTPRSALPTSPPVPPPPRPVSPPMNALRMNPVSPASPSKRMLTSPTTTPRSATMNTTTRSPTARSPTARPLGAGTMSSSPPANGWI